MTEAHDWPRSPFAVGEPVNMWCNRCGERFAPPRPANAGYPWFIPCPLCGVTLTVCEPAIQAALRAREAAEDARCLKAWREQVAREEADKRARVAAAEEVRRKNAKSIKAIERALHRDLLRRRLEHEKQQATRARKKREQAARAVAIDAILASYADKLGRHASRNEYVYLESRAGVPMREIAAQMDISRSRGYQIVQRHQRLLDREQRRQKRMIRCRAHLAQCIEPTPSQRDVWHEYRIEDAYRA